MPALITSASTMTCVHGGTVTAVPGSARARAGAAVLRASDTFIIAGCPFAPGGIAHPCVSVQWVVAAARVQHGGAFVLNEASVGLCLAGDQTPQGMVLIQATQAQVAGL
jgi:hypothetical protein